MCILFYALTVCLKVLASASGPGRRFGTNRLGLGLKGPGFGLGLGLKI